MSISICTLPQHLCALPWRGELKPWQSLLQNLYPASSLEEKMRIMRYGQEDGADPYLNGI